MVSSSLSSRRRYLRRPKVCRSSPNPGRCEPEPPAEPPPPPPTCPPDEIAGFFEMTGIVWCHGVDHHWEFTAARDPIEVDPWFYVAHDVGFPPGNYIILKLWQTPVPKLYARPQFWDMPWAQCAEGETDDNPVVWCEHQALTINTWLWTDPGLSILLDVSW